MNSNRMLVFILLALVVVFVGVGGWLYLSNNSEITKQNNLKNQIVLDKKILTQDETANAAQQQQSVILQSEVATAQTTVVQINFPTAAQTVDDDRVLYSIAANTGLQITSLTATPGCRQYGEWHELSDYNVYSECRWFNSSEGFRVSGRFCEL